MEQIVSQFLLKSLHIILDSRIPSLHPADRSSEHTLASRVRKSDRWFNLVLGDRPAALDNLNFWHRNLTDPMIIDIILIHKGSNSSSLDYSYGSPASRAPSIETVIERWTVHFDSPRAASQGNDSLAQKKAYKKLILLLRALYSHMRLLPAYRIFRQLSSSTQTYNFDIIYKVSSFCDPFSRAEEDMMKNEYTFSPIEAPPGRVCVSVSYRKTLADFNLQPATSLIPRIITDYVGSPATDPLRSFPSSSKGIEAISFPLRGARPPSMSPFQRPHSWTSGIHQGAHRAYGSPPAYGYYASPSPPTDNFVHRSQSFRPPSVQKTSSFDEYQLSPPFSPASSPSPPSHLRGVNHVQPGHSRSGTAPVTIPHPMASGAARYATPNLSDPYRHSLPPPSPRSSRLDNSSQESPSGIRLYRKPEISRTGESHLGTGSPYASHRIMRDARDDSGRFSGLLSSSGSPRIGFSRSSSRLSFQDDIDDGDFSCPFDVDDVDTSDISRSHNLEGRRTSELASSSPMGAKSHDAAVGVLVRMLRTAPPLRQDPSCYSSHSFKAETEGGLTTASGFFMPRKTTDALEELRSYREMKDVLLLKKWNLCLNQKEKSTDCGNGS